MKYSCRSRVAVWLVTVSVVVSCWVLFAPGLSEAKPGHVARWELGKDKAVFWISGQYRPRMEFFQNRDFKEHNDNQLSVPKDVVFISHRARLTAGALLFKRVKVFLQLQDVRRFGSETNTLTDFSADGFDLHQGYSDIRLVDQFYVKVGRMEMNYDGQRLIGAVGWLQQARSFDGILLRYEPKALQLHAFYMHLSEQGAPEDDSHMAAVWFRYRALSAFEPSLFYILDHNSQAKRLRHTFGARLKGKVSGFLYDTEFYMQLGSVGDANQSSDIFAYMLALSAGYQLPFKTKPTFRLFAEFLSGDADTTDTTDRVFDTLFATNHKFYGFVDLFLNIPVHTGRRGLMDFGLSFKIKPTRAMTVLASFHYFRLFAPLPGANGGSDVQELGPEFDVVVKYGFLKGHVVLSGGYGVLVPLEAFQALGKGNSAEHWAFLQLDTKF